MGPPVAEHSEVQLRDSAANLHTLERNNLISFFRLPTSLMPANLHQLMTTQELVDLVRYLASLKAVNGNEGR